MLTQFYSIEIPHVTISVLDLVKIRRRNGVDLRHFGGHVVLDDDCQNLSECQDKGGCMTITVR